MVRTLEKTQNDDDDDTPKRGKKIKLFCLTKHYTQKVYGRVQVRLQRHPLLTSAILEVNKNKKCGVSRLRYDPVTGSCELDNEYPYFINGDKCLDSLTDRFPRKHLVLMNTSPGFRLSHVESRLHRNLQKSGNKSIQYATAL